MGRKSKRQYKKDKKDIIINNFSDEEGELTDAEWERMKRGIEKEMKNDDLVWEAIGLYHELEDENHWLSETFDKPTILDFIDNFLSFNLENKEKGVEFQKEDDGWVTVQ